MVHVAKEMERRGIDAPAPDRRRDDLEAAHRRADRARVHASRRVHVLDASRVDRRRRRPARRRPPRRGSTPRTAPTRSGCARCTPRRARKPLLPLARGAREPHADRLASRRTSPCPRSPGTRVVDADDRDAPRVRRLDVLLPRLGAQGALPGDPRRSGEGRGGARPLRERERAARRDRRGRVAHRARACTASGRRVAEGDDLVLDGGRPLPDAAAAGRRTATRGRTARSPTSSRRPRSGSPITSARSPSRSTAARSSPTRFAAEQGRLPRDHGARARRPARRGVRRVAARGRAPRVVRAERALVRRGADRRALPRDPARVRLSRLPGPLREGDALRAARRRSARASSSPSRSR